MCVCSLIRLQISVSDLKHFLFQTDWQLVQPITKQTQLLIFPQTSWNSSKNENTTVTNHMTNSQAGQSGSRGSIETVGPDHCSASRPFLASPPTATSRVGQSHTCKYTFLWVVLTCYLPSDQRWNTNLILTSESNAAVTVSFYFLLVSFSSHSLCRLFSAQKSLKVSFSELILKLEDEHVDV